MRGVVGAKHVVGDGRYVTIRRGGNFITLAFAAAKYCLERGVSKRIDGCRGVGLGCCGGRGFVRRGDGWGLRECGWGRGCTRGCGLVVRGVRWLGAVPWAEPLYQEFLLVCEEVAV